MARPFMLACLLYGDWPDLASRLLDSLLARLEEGQEYVQDIRLALNACSGTTTALARAWQEAVGANYGTPVILYRTEANVFKYPLMRRMLLDDPVAPAEFVMWFDDDSYLDGPPGWWLQTLAAARQHDMIGQIWYLPRQGRQQAWIERQLWYNPQVGDPPRHCGRPSFRFCQGAWWVIRSEILRRWDWPSRDLRHCGGDSMLGELCRHQGYRLGAYRDGVRINAGPRGEDSKAARRGYSEPVIGKSGVVQEVDHAFPCARTAYFQPLVIQCNLPPVSPSSSSGSTFKDI